MIGKTFGSSGVIFKEKLVVEGCEICANQAIYSALQSIEILNPSRRITKREQDNRPTTDRSI